MESAENTTSVPLLNYGVQSRSRRWRKWLVAFCGLGVVCCIGWAMWPGIQPYWLQGEHLRNQHRLAHQVLPVSMIIYTEDPARIRQVRNQPGYRSLSAFWGPRYNASLPEAWDRTPVHGTFEMCYWGSSIVRGIQTSDTLGYQRTSAGGVRWIVLFDMVNNEPADHRRRKVSIWQNVVTPVGWTPGSRGSETFHQSNPISLAHDDILTLFAPQPDPHGNSRILVPYELNRVSGLMVGTTADDGDVIFSIKTGPAVVVAWNSR